MQEFRKSDNPEKDILNVLKMQKRMGLKRVNNFNNPASSLHDVSFLEWYVFDKLGTTPSAFIGNLESQYYSEQNFRDRRQRNIEFVRGRHFGEAVYDSELQRWVTQWEYLKRRNIPPLTYNVVSKLVRSLTGQFREINTGNIVKCDNKDDHGTELANILTKCLERIKSNNKARSKDASNYKEMLLSGSPVCKIKWGKKGYSNNIDVVYRNVNRSLFMMNPGIVDYDMENLHTATEIHDTTLNAIMESFAKGDYERGMAIKEGYIKYQGDERRQATFSSQSFDGSQLRNNTFHTQGTGNSSYRYYEIWTQISDYEAMTFDPLDGVGVTTCHKFKDPEKVKKEVEAENTKRLEATEGMDYKEEDILISTKIDFNSRFYVIFMTPWGLVLDVRESPYKNGSMPYVFPPPDINGEQWGIVEEVLSAQLSLDRQILQADAIVANASKGVWLIPDTAIPETHTNKEYISELKKVDGAVIYKVRDGAEDLIPKQVYANSANVAGNVQQLIQLYSGLVDEISGNYGAAQGRDSGSTKTATGYALESQNAGLNIRDIMENYLTMLVERDEKILQYIIEGYSRSDYKRVVGIDLDPRELKNFEFCIEQSKGTNSPAHRLALEQELLQLVYNQLLPFDVFLEVSNNPVMTQAKQKWDEWKKRNAMEQQQQGMEQGQQQLPVQQQQLSVDKPEGDVIANELGERPTMNNIKAS